MVGSFGQYSGIASEFYQPLDPQDYFFIVPTVSYQRYFQDIYSGDDRTSKYKVSEMGAGFDLGVNLKSYMEGRVGLRRSVVNAEPDIGDVSLPEFSDIQKSGVLTQIDFDQLNDHRFPTRGIKAQSRVFFSDQGLGADQTYQKLDFLLGKATTIAGRNTFLLFLRGGISLDDQTPYYDKFTAGGFLNLSGLAQDQLRGKNAGVGELAYMYKLVETQGLATKVYVGGSLEAGNVWEDKADFGTDLIYGGSAFIGLDTVLGPLYIGYGQAEGHPGRAFVYLGKTF